VIVGEDYGISMKEILKGNEVHKNQSLSESE
jgi:hypothetical protein